MCRACHHWCCDDDGESDCGCWECPQEACWRPDEIILVGHRVPNGVWGRESRDTVTVGKI